MVQIFTRRGDGPPRLSGSAAVGGYASRQADLGISGGGAGFDYSASSGYESSRGVSAIRPNDQFGLFNPDADGYRRRFANLRFGYAPAPGHRIGINVVENRLDARFDSADFLPPTFAADASGDYRTHLHTGLAALDYRGALASNWTTSVQLAHGRDDSRSGATIESRFITHRDQATWQNLIRLDSAQNLVLAYEHRRDSVGGTVFAEGRERRNNGFVAGYSGTIGRGVLQADLRRDANSRYGGVTTGRLGYAYEVVPGLKLRALAGSSFRAPTFNETDYPFYGIGNLKPERGRSVEIGASWQRNASSVVATLYRNRVSNLIGYNPDPTGTECPPGYFGCAANIAKARLQGVTLAIGHRWQGIDFGLQADLLDATDDRGVRLARRAAHQETLRVDYDAGAWSLGASLLDVGSRPDGNVVLGGYGLVNLRAVWRFAAQWRLEAKLLNAADHRVEPVRDYQGLGRQAWLGIRYDGRGL
ncbi:MAG: TonB-dependent receptor [Pseudomonadota bacterium]|nr:TonB-dependent receptor [Pseudomonadota bacterium]